MDIRQPHPTMKVPHQNKIAGFRSGGLCELAWQLAGCGGAGLASIVVAPLASRPSSLSTASCLQEMLFVIIPCLNDVFFILHLAAILA